ncbi:PREDICTED: copine-7-like [Acropora digitifera]|uniref:copine-7-like n=1 Tax=Acropora digitifera TaxID=70779 RepID=UPI00077AC928|nr:PREDICTED: copine-7-like [Acropora digitifera]
MAQCVTKVELHISCRGLLDKDSTSKSDPLCAVYMQDARGNWVEHARTEMVKNNLNPDFAKGVTLDYFFEMVQKLKFTVYDVDNATSSLADDDFLGEMECTLGQVVSKKSYAQTLKIKGRQVGTITVYAEELKGGNEIVHLTFRSTNLDNKDFMGKSDPFLQISKVKPDGGALLVHRTEVIKNNLNPSWKSFNIPLQTLCSGDYDGPLRVIIVTAVFYFDLLKKFFILIFQKGLDLVNPKKKQKKKGYVNSGVLYISQCDVTKVHTFLDYIMGGCQINFTVGIDFTASNGDPGDPRSLHYINPYEPNEYVRALVAVGEVCQDYDTQYYVLLLLTDGVLTDMEDTKAAIIKASRLPMSVIIVGVGQADFKDMNELDADEGRLRCGRHYADRDIVQFVPYRDFKTQPPAILAKHVLAEIPKQVQEYFSKHGLAPMPTKGPTPPSLGAL